VFPSTTNAVPIGFIVIARLCDVNTVRWLSFD